ncbi:MAG: hypothetical protein V1929_09150 [bacterium]
MRSGQNKECAYGPFQGMNEALDPRHLAASEFASLTNVIVRNGKPAPRPGAQLMTTVLSLSQWNYLTEIGGTTETVNGLAYDSTNAQFYAAGAGGATHPIFRFGPDGQDLEVIINIPSGEGSAKDIALDADSWLYYLKSNAGQPKVVRRSWDSGGGWGGEVTVYEYASVSTVFRMALDVDHSVVYLVVKVGTTAKLLKIDFSAGVPGVMTELVSGAAATIGSPRDVALNADGTFVFWVDDLTQLHSYEIAEDEHLTHDLGDTITTAPSRMLVRGSRVFLRSYTAGYVPHTSVWCCATDGSDILPIIYESTGLPGGSGDWALDTDNYYILEASWRIIDEAWTYWLRRAPFSDDAVLASGYWVKRSLLGVDVAAGEFGHDMVLLQAIDSEQEGSSLVVYWPHMDRVVVLRGGRLDSPDPATIPHALCMTQRDVAPVSGDFISRRSGRMSFAFMGAGVNSGKGGVLIANGDSDRDNPYVLNYVLGDAVYTVLTPADVEKFYLTVDGEDSDSLAYGDTAAAMETVLADMDGVDHPVCTRTGAGPYTYTIRFSGAQAGKDVTLAGTVVGEGTALTVTQTQVGGTELDARLYFRPAGLPRPATPTVAASGSGVLYGAYDYRMDYYSSLFDIEGPPSEISENIAIGLSSGYQLVWTGDTGYTFRFGMAGEWTDYLAWDASISEVVEALEGLSALDEVFVTKSGDGIATLTYTITILGQLAGTNVDLDVEVSAGSYTWTQTQVGGGGKALLEWTLPATPYFELPDDEPLAVNGPLIDRMRIYRRKTGSAVAPDDGVGKTGSWFLVADVRVADLLHYDNCSDSEIDPTAVPVENEYPPHNANFVTIHESRAIYAGITPGDQNVWVSERQKHGGAGSGEFGYEYVNDLSYFTVNQGEADDVHFTGLYGNFGNKLIVGASNRVLIGQISQTEMFGELLTVTPLRGAVGMVSHWCIAETSRTLDDAGYLFWVGPQGHVYRFDGSTTIRISGPMISTINGLVRRVVHDDTNFATDLSDSWYWSSAIFDPARNCLVINAFDLSNNPTQLVLSLPHDSRLSFAWSKWTGISGRAWVVGRELDPDADVPLGTPIVCFGSDDGGLYKLVDGLGGFTATILTKQFDAGAPLDWKLWREAVFAFTRRSFDGAAAAVTITPLVDGIASPAQSTTLTEEPADPTLDRAQAVVNVATRAKDVQFQIEIAQTDDATHPELAFYGIDCEPCGAPREG